MAAGTHEGTQVLVDEAVDVRMYATFRNVDGAVVAPTLVPYRSSATRAGVMIPSQESLERHLTWLYGDPHRCRCAHDWVSAGRQDGISMGHMWARVTTHPDCPEHGTVAEKAREERLHPRRRIRTPILPLMSPSEES